MKLSLGFSPCPNDTFIFDALIHHKIDTEGLEFEVYYDDVETLNQKAFRNELDITKLSFHAFAYAVNNYVLLDAGSALGFGVGPLLISRKDISGFVPEDIGEVRETELGTYQKVDLAPILSELKIGIPGKFTTANFLLSLFLPNAKHKEERLFSTIEDAVINQEIDLGLIIHENRFTYQEKGLRKIIDLGEFWEQLTGCPIPLGGIVIKRSLAKDVQLKVNRVLRKSVEYAFANPKSGLEFIRSHAQAMDEEVMYKHIDLYVNKYSIDLGAEGRKAVELLFQKALEKGVIPSSDQHIFLT
ncbi:menaquinone biosynthesis family protein [Pedobacter sp. SYSU D00535]|uniref:menaquinone biosynthesis family protein n=1 Tax=Pedobacter sp. SYSU D00535 TaxID=2810308 RepID=UPI001A95DFAD|nr:1,4-dihydroxy-6-naphthoate synthase [Pedobacter sp. SYSU D00535]